MYSHLHSSSARNECDPVMWEWTGPESPVLGRKQSQTSWSGELSANTPEHVLTGKRTNSDQA